MAVLTSVTNMPSPNRSRLRERARERPRDHAGDAVRAGEQRARRAADEEERQNEDFQAFHGWFLSAGVSALPG